MQSAVCSGQEHEHEGVWETKRAQAKAIQVQLTFFVVLVENEQTYLQGKDEERCHNR